MFGFAREIFKRYNYAEVRTPIFEHYRSHQPFCWGHNRYRNQGNVRFFMTRANVILPFVLKELPQSFVLMWRTSFLHRKFKNQVSSTTWVQCSAMSVHKQVVYANSTRLVWSALDQVIQPQMLKLSLWQPTS